MTRRSPTNERNMVEDGNSKKGVTRKSASSAKPKRAAASTVVEASAKPKTKAEKREVRKKQNEKARRDQARYSNPPTLQYKRLKRYWIICMVVAVVAVTAALIVSEFIEDSVIPVYLVVLSWVAIIITIYLDLGPIRRAKKGYKSAVSGTKADKAKRRAEKQAAKKAAEKEAARKASGEKKGLFSKKKTWDE